MAKVKIINSENLKYLKVLIIEEIDHAQIQAEIYSDEAEKQRQTKHSCEIIDDRERQKKSWLDRRSILHECLVKIEKYSNEINI